MLNPEGVIWGNNRWSLFGFDLNRTYLITNKVNLFRYYILQFIILKKYLIFMHQKIKYFFIVIYMLIVQSKISRKNIFMYGN